MRKATVFMLTFYVMVINVHAQPAYIQKGTQEIYLNGINLAWINFSNDLDAFNQAQFTTALQEVKAAGGNCIRWWLHTDGVNSPDYVNDYASGISASELNNLKTALDLASENGIGLDLCLWSFDMLGPTANSKPAAVISRNTKFMTDTAYTNAYIRNVLIPMVAMFKNHPGVMCWEVFNEPEGMSTQFGWTVQAKVNMSYIQRVVNLIAGAIHREAPDAIVSNGSWSFTASTDVGSGHMNYYRKDRLIAAGGDTAGYLDLYQVHYYPDNFSLAESPFYYPASHWGLDKPLVIGEFPAVGINEDGTTNDLTAEQAYTYLYNNGYTGALSWTYNGGGALGGLPDCSDALSHIQSIDPDHVNLIMEGINITPYLISYLPEGMAYANDTDTITIGNVSGYFYDEDVPGLQFSMDSNQNSIAYYEISTEGLLKVIPKSGVTGIMKMDIAAVDTGGKSTTAPFFFSLIDSSSQNRFLFRNAYASTIENSAYYQIFAVDTSIYSTRWSTQYKNNQWLLIKMDKEYSLQQIMMRWEAAYGKQYTVEVSEDSIIWQTVFNEIRGNGGWDKIIFDPVIVKYVRLNCIRRGTQWGFSLFDIAAYSEKTSNQAPYIANPVADVSSHAGTSFTVSVASVAADPDLGERFNYNFELLDGSALPSWLNYNDTTMMLTGNPLSSDTGIYQVVLGITDLEGTLITDTFAITINEIVTDISIAKLNGNIKVYPNPTSGKIWISLASSPGQFAMVEIFNLDGRLVKSQNFQNVNMLSVDLSGNTPGLYLLRLSIDGNIINKKICLE